MSGVFSSSVVMSLLDAPASVLAASRVGRVLLFHLGFFGIPEDPCVVFSWWFLVMVDHG
jgi:hypothetical protein